MSPITSSEKRKRFHDLPELSDGQVGLLLSSVYVGDEQAVYLLFYDFDENGLVAWRDRTNHRPYCYTKMEYRDRAEAICTEEKKLSIQRTKKRDLINDQIIEVLKIVAPDPLSIGGTENSVRERVRCWEADIKYHENYLYDSGLIPGSYYRRKGDSIVSEEYGISEAVKEALMHLILNNGDNGKKNDESQHIPNDGYQSQVISWASLLNQPIPELKRVALDIEVESEEGQMPTPREHDRRVIAVGLVGTDGFRKVLVLDGRNSNTVERAKMPEAELCPTEKELIEKTFMLINSYPIVITYNGDDFDLPYLYSRSQDSRIDPITHSPIPKEQVPILVKRDSFIRRGTSAEPIRLKNAIHLDLFRTFQNRSIQIYAFGNKYSEYTLNAISLALLGEGKLDLDLDIAELPLQKLAEYCLRDADLTFRLTSFGNNLLMKLMLVIARIARSSLEDVSRFGVNQWIRGMLYFEHRKNNLLIPRREELSAKGSSSTVAIIKEKKYRGGLVVEPKLGIHFNVVVVDFASLYPSIIKVHNLSYETVNCPHQDCKADKAQLIDGTTHWICKKNRGLTSQLIGSLRDLRVRYYKQLSKDKSIGLEERLLYSVVSQAIKVILNASYGVMGAEIFPLYCLPVADATAALGRMTTYSTIEKCREIGVDVIYGDTDSLFLKGPSTAKVDEITRWARAKYGVDLEIDKTYRYVVFSELKKNYLGVLSDGTVDVKGLTGKKSHTPPFIRRAFSHMLDILGKVDSENDFESAREKIKSILQENAKNLVSKRIPLQDLSFNVMINKSPDKYGQKVTHSTGESSLIDGSDVIGRDSHKGIPQHIKAAKLLVEQGKEIKAGGIISYVKTRTSEGVKPVELAKPEEIDTDKYLETMEVTFDQILASLNFNFKSLVGQPRQSNLDELFWGAPA
ncbi:MAG TPA: DNA-directed DNA polymerase I [Nitrososphaeraceae archaeon]|nr:DNA-directed DNA polymerase I [Nitrososphaeraceae archaeon]